MANESYSPTSNLWRNPALRTYLGEIKRRHGVVDTLALPNMRDLPPLRIENLFVQPLLSTTAVASNVDSALLKEGKSLLAIFHSRARLVVLGDPGSGKTTLSNWLAWRLSSGFTTDLPPSLEGRVPIPCVLREIGRHLFTPGTNVHELALHIAERLLGEKVRPDLRSALSHFVSEKKYVLILDGVDEIPLKYRKHVSRWIEQAAVDDASLLATSRIVGYEDFPIHRATKGRSLSAWKTPYSLSVESALVEAGLSRSLEAIKVPKIARDLYSKVWDTEVFSKFLNEGFSNHHADVWAEVNYLLPFDESRIAAFVECWYLQRCSSEVEAKQRRDDLLVALGQSKVTRELAGTPNLLSLMAIVHRERAHLPDGKALLYKEIANAYINTIDQYRKIAADDVLAPYGVEAREGWIAYVGFRMQLERVGGGGGKNEQAGVLVEEKKVLSWLEQAMGVSGVAEASSVAPEFLRWVARRCGLLLPRGEGRFAFVHLSFQEYFCARFLVSRIITPSFVRSRSASDGFVTDAKLKSWAVSPLWQEIMIHLFELISGEQGADWVEDLASILFDVDGDFPEQISTLASKILSDRHINLSADRKRSMAAKFAWQAFYDMRNILTTSDGHALRTLLLSGFGLAYIGQNEIPYFKDIPTLKKPNFDVGMANREQFVIFARGGEVDNIDSLRLMPNLRGVDLEKTSVRDIGAIRGLGELNYLNLGDSKVKDFASLAELLTLRELKISGTRPRAFAFLSKLLHLERLEMAAVGLKRIPQLSKLKALRWLTLDGNPVESLERITPLKGLAILTINHTRVVDLSPIATMQSLLFLSADGVPLRTIAKLPPSLRWLSVGQTMIDDLSFLKGLKRLEVFIASRSKVVEISPISTCGELEMLDLSGTLVADISALADLKRLTKLDLSFTRVTDLSPLRDLTNLRELRISGLDVEPNDLKHLSNLQFIH